MRACVGGERRKHAPLWLGAALCLVAVTATAQTPSDPSRFGLPPGSVERVEKRTANAKHFRRPDGSMVAIIGAGPLHYRDAGLWQDIDTTFHDDGAGGFISDHAPVQVDAKPNGQISVTRGGVGIRWLTPVNLGPQGGNAVGGSDAKGIQWRWTATGTGLKLNGMVTAPQGPQTYGFQYQLLGISDFSIDAGGNAVAGGGVVVPRAFVHGADGKDYPVAPWQAAPGPHLEFSFDDSTLPPAAYPYVIDPTLRFELGVCCAEEAGIICPDWALDFCVTDLDCAGIAGAPVCAGAGTDTGQTGDTATVYGYLNCSSAATSDYPGDCSMEARNGKTGSTFTCENAYAAFTTASIGAGNVVTDVDLRVDVWDTVNGDTRNLTGEYFNWGNAIDCSDWSKTPGSNAFSVPISSLSPGSVNDITLSNVSNINLTGMTKIRFGISGGASAPAAENYVVMGAYRDGFPRLVVTYSEPTPVPTATPPMPIVYLGTGYGGSASDDCGTTAVWYPPGQSLPAGNLLVVTAGSRGFGTFTNITCSDPKGNTWTTVGLAVQTTATRVAVAQCYSVLQTGLEQGDGVSVVYQETGTTCRHTSAMMAFSGIAGSPVDRVSTNVGSSNAATSGLTATTSQADELLIGAHVWNTWTYSNETGWTWNYIADSQSASYLLFGYATTYSTGAYESTSIGGSSVKWAADIVTYKAGLPPSTFTPTSTSTATPTQTPTKTPTDTATPTATAVALPTPSACNEVGNWQSVEPHITASGSTLTHDSSTQWFGASSSASLSSHEDAAAGSYYMRCRLTATNAFVGCGLGPASLGAWDIYAVYGVNYAIVASPFQTLTVYESGIAVASVGSYSAGDDVLIDVSSVDASGNTYPKYYVCASGLSYCTLLYTSTVAATYPLYANVLLYSPGSEVTAVYLQQPGCLTAQLFVGEGTWQTDDGTASGTWQGKVEFVGEDLGGHLTIASNPDLAELTEATIEGTSHPGIIDVARIHTDSTLATMTGTITDGTVAGTFAVPDGRTGTWQGQITLIPDDGTPASPDGGVTPTPSEPTPTPSIATPPAGDLPTPVPVLDNSALGPSRIIVKFKDALTANAADLLANGQPFAPALTDASSSLDELNQIIGVTAASEVFFPHRGMSTSQAQAAFQLQTQAVLSRYPERTARIPAGCPPAPDLTNIYTLVISSDADPELACALYAADPHVAWCQPDYPMTILDVSEDPYPIPEPLGQAYNDLLATYTVPDDPYFLSSGSWGQPYADLWGLKGKGIRADRVWSVTQGEDIKVAVVDSGVYPDHPEINANLLRDENGAIVAKDFVVGDDVARDPNGHGTHVAGTIAAVANNAIGIIGVAPGVKIMSVRGLDGTGSGYSQTLAQALQWAADHGAAVINNSWGARRVSSIPVVEGAVIYAARTGAVVVFAAGNEADDVYYSSPVNMTDRCYKPVVVAANDVHHRPAVFPPASEGGRLRGTNYGATVDVSAPGGGEQSLQGVTDAVNNILSLLSPDCDPARVCPRELMVGDRYLRLAGTSMAAPHVSDLAALILAHNPLNPPDQTLTQEDVRHLLQISGRFLVPNSKRIGFGQVDAPVAMSLPRPAIVRLTAPERLQSLDSNAGPVAVRGTASGDYLRQWRLSYGVGSAPLKWRLIKRGVNAVYDGLLALWDASRLTSGIYTLQLLASNGPRSFSEEVQFVSVPTPTRTPLPTPPGYASRLTTDDTRTYSHVTAAGNYVAAEAYSAQSHTSLGIALIDTQGGGESLVSPPDSKSPAFDPHNSERLVYVQKVNGVPEIHLYTITSYGGVHRPITAVGSGERDHPSIGGNHIVWQDDRDQQGVPQIYTYDLNSENGTDHRLMDSSDPSLQIAPRISGSVVVWQEQSPVQHCSGIPCLLSVLRGLYSYDFTTGGQTVFLADDTRAYAVSPDISGNWIVWTKDLAALYAYNMTTGDVATLNWLAWSQNAAIWGDWVAWYGRAGEGYGPLGIFVYDLVDRGLFMYSDPNPTRNQRPAVSSQWVAWLSPVTAPSGLTSNQIFIRERP